MINVAVIALLFGLWLCCCPGQPPHEDLLECDSCVGGESYGAVAITIDGLVFADTSPNTDCDCYYPADSSEATCADVNGIYEIANDAVTCFDGEYTLTSAEAVRCDFTNPVATDTDLLNLIYFDIYQSGGSVNTIAASLRQTFPVAGAHQNWKDTYTEPTKIPEADCTVSASLTRIGPDIALSHQCCDVSAATCDVIRS